jgi:hypothetical protein
MYRRDCEYAPNWKQLKDARGDGEAERLIRLPESRRSGMSQTGLACVKTHLGAQSF